MPQAKQQNKKLAYSPLTKEIYWVDGKGEKTLVTQNFIQVMLLWGMDGDVKDKDSYSTDLKVNGEIKYTINITKHD